MKPPAITSNFAIHDVPVTITSVIDMVHSQDDGVSIEFALKVQQVHLGTPQKVGPTDALGRPRVRAKEVKAGDTCMKVGTRKRVKKDIHAYPVATHTNDRDH